jgi:hypothetical protein
LSGFAIAISTIAMLAAGIRPIGYVLLAPVLWVLVLVVYAANGIAKYYLAGPADAMAGAAGKDTAISSSQQRREL